MKRLNSSDLLNMSTPRRQLAETKTVEEPVSAEDIVQAVFLVLVIIIGIVANTLICLVIYKRRSLHTVLYSFLVSLSVSDLLHASLKMPTTFLSTLHIRWYPHPAICYVTTPFGVLFGAGTVFNLCAVALNQFFIIVNPLHYPLVMTATHARYVIAGLWAGSVLISLPPVFWRSPDTICKSGAVSRDNYSSELLYFVSLWTFVVIIPSIVMGTSYTKIFLVARRQIFKMKEDNQVNGELSASRSRRKSFRAAALLALVGGIFIFCWLPFFIVQTLHKFSSAKIASSYFRTFLCIMYSKSAINPLVYTGLNKELRKALLLFLRLRNNENGHNSVLKHEPKGTEIGDSLL